MRAFIVYLSAGLLILWIASVLASFVKKKTNNTFFSVAAGLVSAYLLLEFALILIGKLGK